MIENQLEILKKKLKPKQNKTKKNGGNSNKRNEKLSFGNSSTLERHRTKQQPINLNLTYYRKLFQVFRPRHRREIKRTIYIEREINLERNCGFDRVTLTAYNDEL